MATSTDEFANAAAKLAAGVLTILGYSTPAALVALVPTAVALIETVSAAGVDVPGLDEIRKKALAFGLRADAPTKVEDVRD